VLGLAGQAWVQSSCRMNRIWIAPS
jgi:hypothetical protein